MNSLAYFSHVACMTYQERLQQLKDEISAFMAQYGHLNTEIFQFVENGLDEKSLAPERGQVADHCNRLLDEYHNLASYNYIENHSLG